MTGLAGSGETLLINNKNNSSSDKIDGTALG